MPSGLPWKALHEQPVGSPRACPPGPHPPRTQPWKTHLSTPTCTYPHQCTYTLVHTLTQSTFMCSLVYIHTLLDSHTHTFICLHLYSHFLLPHTCSSSLLHLRLYRCAHTHLLTLILLHSCTHTLKLTHEHMHVFLHSYTFTYSHTLQLNSLSPNGL